MRERALRNRFHHDEGGTGRKESEREQCSSFYGYLFWAAIESRFFVVVGVVVVERREEL